ncbi:non-ribosomal peptide synthetase [Pseudoalteromonas sp. T1lg23B]|uniref:non-ribosomal peptide synthetase n=1 Tax=Pseudoalteromonas sp. T1lg23B TaxID=2077097 RepID=UPI000CF747A5|nr:non-ribosomal peptide synthetase [Pseudoalteromonas sp. T1lg23B]
MNEQTLLIENLIGEALAAGITLYEKNGGLAFKQSGDFPDALKARIIANKAQIIEYFVQQKFTQSGSKSDSKELVAVSRDASIPLSFAQEGLWFIEQLQGSKQYYMPAEFKLHGNIDVSIFKQTIAEIIARHELLRTQFIADEQGVPQQRIQATMNTPFTWINASEFAPSERAAQIQQVLVNHQAQAFDLSHGPLLRVLLVSDANEHWLAFNMHHIISDGASLARLVMEIETIYAARLSGTEPALPVLSIQYADYSHWQRDTLNSEYLATATSYWKNQLTDLEPIQSLPTDRPRPAVQALAGQVFHQQLSVATKHKLLEQSAKQNVTPFMWVLSCFMLFIGRLNQADKVLIGTPVLGRIHPKLEPLIGLFVNTIVIPADLDDNSDFTVWLQKQKEQILQAFEYQNMPFDKLVDALHCKRDLSHHPLVQILFTLEQTEQGAFSLPGLTIEEARVQQSECAIKCDLELNVQLNEHGVLLNWKFDSALYDLATISNWADSFALLLEHVSVSPNTVCAHIPMVTERQKQALLAQPQCHNVSWPQAENLVSIFERQVERFGSHIALSDEHNVLTYSALNQRANELAHVLLAQGVSKEQMIPVSVSRSVDLVVTLLAILKAGCAYVPIDPDYPQDRIDYIINDVNSTKQNRSLLICDESCYQRFQSLADDVINISDGDIYHGGKNTANPNIEIRPEYLAYMIYTSGTTGRPKGVQIEHRQVVRLLFTEPSLFDFNEHDVWTLFHSFCFDFSVWEMYGALLFGGRLVVVSTAQSKDSNAFAKLLIEQQVSVLNQTPSAFYVLQSSMLALKDTQLAQSRIRYVIFGGEALAPAKLAPWAKRFNNCALINMYGITETTVHVTFKRITGDEISQGASNIGHPIPTTSCYVLDRQQQLLPPGAMGELYVGGQGVCRGYWQRDDLNVERFIADPFTHNGKLYKTGDLVRYLASGELLYISRIDDQVKVRGYRIELGEIENQLRTHPWLAEVVVLLNRDDTLGARICAFVVLDAQAQFDDLTSQTQQYLRQTLPEFMLPSSVIAVSEMPLTVNGKVDKKALLALDVVGPSDEFTEPNTPIEKLIADCFSEVLQVPKVGRDCHFFRLGGHSLLATQVITRLREQAKLNVTLKDLFQQPKVKSLAALAQSNQTQRHDSQDIMPQARAKQSMLPLSFAQQRLWSIDQIQQGSLEYHMSAAFALKGMLNIDAFTQAWQAIVARHEVLRTCIVKDQDGRPIQKVNEVRGDIVNYVDSTALSDEQKRRVWLKVLRDDRQTPFKLDSDLMIRVVLVKWQCDDYRLLVNMHHIASDAKSLDILVTEFSHFYHHYAHTQALPENLRNALPIQYADYALWQRKTLTAESLEQHRAFWLEHLSGAPPLHQLPLDKPRTKQLSTQGAHVTQKFSKATCEAIRAHCQRLDITAFTWLHSAYSLLIARYSNSCDVVIGAPFSGRHHTQLEPLVGFFVNTLPIRTVLTPKMSFEGLLLQQKKTLQEIHQHQHMPFEQIVEQLKLSRDLSHQSVFQLTFSLNPKIDTRLKLAGLESSAIATLSEQVKFDIELSCTEELNAQGQPHMRFTWAYNKHLFSEHTISAMANAFAVLVEQIIQTPNRSVFELPLLTQEQIPDHILHGKYSEDGHGQTVIDQIASIAHSHESKDNVALVDPTNTQTVTYHYLEQRSTELAKYLLANGLLAEQCVMVSMASGIDLVVTLLAVLKAGGCYVPVDPNYPQARIDFIASDCKAKWLITRSRNIDKFSTLVQTDCHVLCIDDYHLEHDIFVASKEVKSLPVVKPEQLAYVIYTSGTTGNPKGVMIPHHGLMNLCLWHRRAFDVSEQSVASQTANIAFDAAAWELWPYLCRGATVVTIARDTLNSPSALSSVLTRNKVTHCFLATPIAEVMLADKEFAPQYLHYLLVGGDKLNQVDVSERPFTVVNNYGPTEASVVATSGTVVSNKQAPDIGSPIDNTSLYILDDLRHPVPKGMVGELYVAGEGLARGYLCQEQLTEQRFVTLNCEQGKAVRAYQTGDLVRCVDNNRIAYVGRNDEQVKLRGYRIELAEIEQVLLSHHLVDECVVQICTSAKSVKQLVAFIVSNGNTERTVHDAATQLVTCKLPVYMHPSHYILIQQLPLTAHGKIDHRALNELAFNSEPVVSTSNSESSEPLNSTQSHLLKIYREVLNNDAFTARDDFFAHGGDSILSIQIASRARAIGLSVSVADVFNYSSIETLAEQVQDLTVHHSSFSPVAAHVGEFRALPIQQWFFEQQFAQPTHWNQALMLSLDKSLSWHHMTMVLQSLIAHHDGLRVVTDGATVEVIDDFAIDEVLQQIDLSDAPDWRSALATEAQHIQASFVFSRRSLLRACYVKTPQHESANRLLIVAHHLVIDGVSWRIVLEDMQYACESVLRGNKIEFTQHTTNLRLVSEFFVTQGQEHTHLDKWQQLAQRAKTPNVLALRVANNQKPRAANYKLTCATTLTNTLLKDANHAYGTGVQTLLLSALQWSMMLHYHTKSQVIMLEGHGRELLQQQFANDRSVGWLTSLFPLHLFSNASNLSEVICNVKEQLAITTKIASSYGALRYNHPLKSVRESLHIDTRDKVFFNYLGQLDGALSKTGLLTDAKEAVGKLHGDDNQLYYGLQITAAVSDSQLTLSFDFDSHRISEDHVEAFAQHFLQSLQNVVNHCVEQTDKYYTPSDFSLLTGVSRLQLQSVVAPFATQSIEDIYPLSMLQQGMWLHSQRLSQNSSPYLEQAVMKFEGELDIEAFAYAWQRVIATHSILRSAFVHAIEEPLQVVVSQCELPLQVDTPIVTQQSDEQIAAYIASIAKQEYEAGIDLTRAPCMRLRLVPMADSQYGFIWTYHHLIMDGWSLPILFANLMSLYNARITGQVVQISQDNYRDYIAYLLNKGTQSERTFWREYLSDAPEPTLLSAHIATQTKTEQVQIKELEIELEAQQYEQLREFAQNHSFTLNHVLQAVWGYWLSVCCDKDYALFGQTISGRPSELANVEQKVGLYINTQAVKLAIPDTSTVVDYINSVKHNQLQLAQYSHSALTLVHDCSEIENGTELFDALYVFENYPTDPLDSAEHTPFRVTQLSHKDDTHYPITFVVGTGQRLSLTLGYDTSLFSHSTAQQSLQTIQSLLNAFISSPQSRLNTLPLTSSRNDFLEIDTFNLELESSSDFVPFVPASTLQQRFADMVKRYPQAIALEFYHDDQQRTMSYATLDNEATKLACYLKTRMAHNTSQPIVAVCLAPSFDLITAILACLKLGAAYLPISPQLPFERRDFMVSDANVSALITDSNTWQGTLPACPCINMQTIDTQNVTATELPDVTYLNHDLCYVIYTSGTTGIPKGVMVEQRSVMNYVSFLSQCYGITAQDNYLQFASCSFDVFAEEVFCTLLNGATLVMSDNKQLLSASGLAQVAQRSALTLMSLPTAYWHQLALEQVDLGSRLRVITIGGEQMQLSALSSWQRHYGDKVRLINAYGPTEATISATLKDVTNHKEGDVSIGNPVAHTQLAILDKHLRALPDYIPGELYISGHALARGYLGDTEKTNQAFIVLPYSKQRLYKTGDKVRLNEHRELEFIGRLDEQVKIRGYRVELGEIERSLLQDEKVAACAVVIRDDASGSKQLVAFLVTHGSVSEAQICSELARKVPDYMVPQQIIRVNELPLTTNGKVDRKRLAAQAKAAKQVHNNTVSEAHTPLQRALSNQLKTLLDLEYIGLDDDIFTLGVHSLLAMRLVGQLGHTLNLSVPIDLVFQHRSVRALSDAIELLAQEKAQDSKPLPLTSLLCLQKGQAGYAPIVLIAGAGGLLMAFQALVQNLDERIPVYGLQPDEIAYEHRITGSIHATADHYLEALNQAGLTEQVHLVGHSFGSFIAYEMAKYRQDNHLPRVTLTVLDTPVPTSQGAYVDDKQCSLFILENFSQFFSLQVSEEQHLHYQSLDSQQQLLWLSHYLADSGYRFSIEQLDRFKRVFSAQLNAPVQLDELLNEIPTLVIKASQTSHFAGEQLSSDLGWARLCKQLQQVELQGDHLTILQNGNAREVALLLEKNYVLN